MDKEDHAILELLNECGVKGKPNWKDELPLNFCMFHEHNYGSPSLQINLKKRLYYCYACRASGHIRRIFYINGISGDVFWGGINTHEDFYTRLVGTLKDFETPEEERSNADVRELLAYNFYHPYLIRRGFSREVLVKNKIGFNKENARITIPVFFGDNYFGTIQRTVVDESPKYIYPANFQKSALLYEPKCVSLETDEFEIWTEGSLDALKVADFGFAAKSVLGCSLSKRQVQMLNKVEREVIIAFDSDEAGAQGTMELLDRVERFDISVLKMPERVKDIGEMSKEQFLECIKKRKHRTEYLTDSLFYVSM